jgi:hypothetical protein
VAGTEEPFRAGAHRLDLVGQLRRERGQHVAVPGPREQLVAEA